MKAVTKEERRVAYPFVLIFLVLSLGIAAGGVFYYRHYERQFRAGIEQQLSAIAELKVNELAQYSKERLWDAATFFKNAAFSGVVRRFFDHPEDAEAQEQLRTWLDKYRTGNQNDCIFLLDVQGVERMSIPADAAPVSAVFLRRAGEVLQSREIVFHDFHRNEQNHRIYLTLLVPILDGPDYGRPLGVLALRVDPETYLYPLLKRWPTPSQTAETLLVRRDGNEAVFLNELKFQTNTALTLRATLDQTNLPAVKAVLGQTGIVEGVDYRNMPVIADVRPVPNSPWFLVARIDDAEVYAPLRERLWMTILLAGLLVVCAGAGAGAVWRHQSINFYKEQYRLAGALQESKELLRAHTDNSPMAVIEWNADQIITRWTGAAEKIFGWKAKEAVGKSIVKLPKVYEEDLLTVQNVIKQLTAEGTKHVLSSNRNCTRNGQVIDCEWYSSVLRDAQGKAVSVLSQVLDVTERKRMDLALAESRNFLGKIINSVADPVFVKDRQHRWALLNEACCDFVGRRREELLGKSNYDFFPKSEADVFWEKDEAVFTTGVENINEEKFTDARGMVRSIITKKTLYTDDKGEKFLVGIISDITERKRAEAELRQERNLFRTVLDNLPSIIYSKDKNGRYVLSNSAHQNMLGTTQEKLLDKTAFDFHPPELARQYHEDEMQIMRSGKALPPREEQALNRKTGGYWWHITSRIPLKDDKGQVIGVVGISHDVTERKKMEEALRESQALYHSLVEQMPAGVFRKDREGRYVLVNDWFCQLRGMKAKEILGKTPEELITVETAAQGDKRPEITRLLSEGTKHHEQIMRTGERIEVEEEYPAENGRKRYLRVVKSPVFGPDEKIIGTQGVQFDITERKQTEEALERTRLMLEAVLEQSPVPIMVANASDLVLSYDNRAAIEFLGVSDEPRYLGLKLSEIQQRQTWRDFRPDGTLIAPSDMPFARAFRGEVTRNKEFSVIRKDGTQRWGLANATPIYNRSGQLLAALLLFWDITERKRAEEQLQESQALYFSFVEQLPVGVFRKDAAGRYVLVNPWFCKLKNMKAEHFLGKTAEEVAASTMRQKVNDPGAAVKYAAVGKNHHEQIMQNGQPIDTIEEYTDADGKKQFIRALKLPVFGTGGKIIGSQGILIDITESKKPKLGCAGPTKHWPEPIGCCRPCWIIFRTGFISRTPSQDSSWSAGLLPNVSTWTTRKMSSAKKISIFKFRSGPKSFMRMSSGSCKPARR